MRIALVQFNPMVGDVANNARRIVDLAHAAFAGGPRVPGGSSAPAHLIVFPELALVGYPPRDLLLQEGFLDAVRDESLAMARALPMEAMVLVGAPWKPIADFFPRSVGQASSLPSDERQAGSLPHRPGAWDAAAATTNSVLCFRGGRIEARYDKRLLPTYDVFDEDRYFTPGTRPVVLDVEGTAVGVSICEDLWRGDDARATSRYANAPDPVADLIAAGATLIVNPSASPFVLGKGERQRNILKRHAKRHNVTVAAVNQVGGNDDLIFDGHAAIYAPSPDPADEPILVAAAPGFTEHTLLCEIPPRYDGSPSRLPGPIPPVIPDPLLTAPSEQLLWQALVLGVRDYCRKTNFKAAVLGLSGGIDSALVAAIAAAALGTDNVTGVLMPSRYSSQGSLDDARTLASNLNIHSLAVPIEPPHAVMESLLAPAWRQLNLPESSGITEENLQSRLRGIILMAFSNKSGAILLTTGNKSELAVGYCTLYGDMNGGLAVLPDVTKMQVYALSRWINANHTACGFTAPPIPESSITKAPSAELRPNQTDQDSLPPYEVLDEIIERYIEQHHSAARIIRETSINEATVRRVIRLIDVNEYKRKQTPVGLKVTDKSFGPGRRQPIAQGWRADKN